MKHCLVVDDSSVIRKVARRILEDLSFEIVEAEDGKQALDLCRQKMPDAILLDWNMPVMNGLEFLSALRQEPGGEAPKVVFCTTENDVAHIARAIRAGSNKHIMQHFDRAIVRAKLAEVGHILLAVGMIDRRIGRIALMATDEALEADGGGRELVAEARGVTARHQRGARGRAGRVTGIARREIDAIMADGVDIGRLDETARRAAAIKRDVIEAHVVGEDDDHVRLALDARDRRLLRSPLPGDLLIGADYTLSLHDALPI